MPKNKGSQQPKQESEQQTVQSCQDSKPQPDPQPETEEKSEGVEDGDESELEEEPERVHGMYHSPPDSPVRVDCTVAELSGIVHDTISGSARSGHTKLSFFLGDAEGPLTGDLIHIFRLKGLNKSYDVEVAGCRPLLEGDIQVEFQ